MIRSLWIAKSGMEGQQFKLDTIANNLANVGTNGFKRGGVVFEDLMYDTCARPARPAANKASCPPACRSAWACAWRPRRATSARATCSKAATTWTSPSRARASSRCRCADGSTAYTRDGSFQLDGSGQMVTSDGHVLQPGITIPANAQSVSIAANGTVSVTVPGQAAAQTVGQLQLASFVNPSGLDPRGQNLYAETASSGAPANGAPGADGLGALLQGYVEGSNVNVVEELVSMIATQRAYELNSKAIQTTDQMLQRLGQL